MFINISLKEQARESLAEFERRIAEHDEVMECDLVTGDRLPDPRGRGRHGALTPIPGIEKIRSSFFALKQLGMRRPPLPVVARG